MPYDPAAWKTEADYEADCRRSTLQRKIKEALFAMAMELRYSKDEILTIYLNRAYLGAGTRGLRGRGAALFRQVRERGEPVGSGDAGRASGRAVALRADRRPPARAGPRRA